MLLPLLTLVALQAPTSFQTDTSVAVPQGTRLSVENQGGDITVKTWDRNQVRIQASHSRRTRIDIRLSGSVLTLEAEADRGPANMVDYVITAPVWMALALEGMYATVTVDGTRAPIAVETLDGDITVTGGAETVELESVQGRISLTGARGKITLTSVSEDIEASDIQGEITAESVSGDIMLRRIESRAVDVQTVSGELVYDGNIVASGRYSLLTHSGNIVVSVAEGANATIATAVGSGRVNASFAIAAAERTGRRRQTFRLGSGAASVELETFSGNISLLRPAEVLERLDRRMRIRLERDAQQKRNRPEMDHEGAHDHIFQGS